MPPLNPFDILKFTPKSNCGECGQPTCLAFASVVARGGGDPTLCPHLSEEGRRLIGNQQPGEELEALAGARDQLLVEQLRQKIQGLDFSKIAGRLGCQWQDARPDELRFRYLGGAVVFSKDAILWEGEVLPDPRDQILLSNYVYFGGGQGPASVWVGMENLPNSISKVKTLRVYCEERIARAFSGHSFGEWEKASHRLEARPVPEQEQASASYAMIFPVLPAVEVYLLFWEAEPDDDFDARAKVLFDRNVLGYLDLESLVFAAERLAERLEDLLRRG